VKTASSTTLREVQFLQTWCKNESSISKPSSHPRPLRSSAYRNAPTTTITTTTTATTSINLEFYFESESKPWKRRWTEMKGLTLGYARIVIGCFLVPVELSQVQATECVGNTRSGRRMVVGGVA
jgi:hypothetical protein